ncbi:MAG: hypothetical protein J7M32_03705 [Deltaproteobacteria bacterium]|nr:hypothetical protein [Deltaproteobacteria bacterium]
MKFSVVQECPQCGAPLEMDEADRLLPCPFCGVASFLFSDDCYRFVLPSRESNRDLIFAPYLRFKGTAFHCDLKGVHYRILDITQLGIPFKRFPMSLGLRPQAMKMRFAHADVAGSFLKCFLKTDDMLERAKRHSSAADMGEALCRIFIGDAVSLIYLPLYVERGVIFDGVTNRPVAALPKHRDILSSIADHGPRWKLTFLPTLCPRCGWNLTGERDSVVLTCRNCETAWEVKKGKFVQRELGVVSADSSESIYLPFWKMAVETTGIPIASYADFIRATNQPRVVQRKWEDQNMYFWSPAFKIRPSRFLYLSRQLTVMQIPHEPEGRLPPGNLYPATVPLSEAIQGIKITLAGTAVNKKVFMPRLQDIRLSIRGASLIYLPFRETSHELVQEHTRVSINRTSLNFGRFL